MIVDLFPVRKLRLRRRRFTRAVEPRSDARDRYGVATMA
jgi:hypothetical protein